jgi:hypothetical protein
MVISIKIMRINLYKNKNLKLHKLVQEIRATKNIVHLYFPKVNKTLKSSNSNQ